MSITPRFWRIVSRTRRPALREVNVGWNRITASLAQPHLLAAKIRASFAPNPDGFCVILPDYAPLPARGESAALRANSL